MKTLLILCAGFLFLGIADLPIGYYTLLRIVVTIGSVIVILNEFKGEFNFWVITFGLLVILFNPIIPVYFQDKSVWIPIDFIGGIIFLVKSFNLKNQ